MNWDDYDNETNQRIEHLTKTLPWHFNHALESAAMINSYIMWRDIDKRVLQRIYEIAERKRVKRLWYKHNKKYKFKKVLG